MGMYARRSCHCIQSLRQTHHRICLWASRHNLQKLICKTELIKSGIDPSLQVNKKQTVSVFSVLGVTLIWLLPRPEGSCPGGRAELACSKPCEQLHPHGVGPEPTPRLRMRRPPTSQVASSQPLPSTGIVHPLAGRPSRKIHHERQIKSWQQHFKCHCSQMNS